MISFLCFVIFMILNFINANILIMPIYGINSWQYWIGTVCTCGCYLIGAIKYILKK